MDDRHGKNTQLPLPDLLRQSIFSRLAGYEDVNDAERLSQDPTFRLIGSEKIWERGAALPSRLHWFEAEVLSQEENLAGQSRINRELLAKADDMDAPRRVECWIWTARKSRSTENRSTVPTTVILSRPAITRCCCSTGRETVWERSCGPATYTVPRTGRKCFCRRSSGNRNGVKKWCFGPMPRLPNRRSTKRWYNGEHHHSGIGLLTPEAPHYRRRQEAIARRQQVLNQLRTQPRTLCAGWSQTSAAAHRGPDRRR